MRFVKGHGAQNDFVLLDDHDGTLDLTRERVVALCDRRRGLGADGVLRVVRAGALGEPVANGIADTDWFMDYRNADGTAAEMCGNGVRVFAQHLVVAGLVVGPEMVVGSRAGPRPVVVHHADSLRGDVEVDMGPARLLGDSHASVEGVGHPGVGIDVGNPHLACVLAGATPATLAGLDLTVPPGHDAAMFPHGVNVELLTPLADGAVHLRVHERGVGETRACGTGTIAAAVAALRDAGRPAGQVRVHSPGGAMTVRVTAETTFLRGPSVLLARGTIDARWFDAPD